RLAVPDQRLGGRTLGLPALAREGRHVDRQGYVAPLRQQRPPRTEEIFASIEEFAGADVVAIAMRVGVEDGRMTAGGKRAGEQAAHRGAGAEVEAQLLEDI